VMMGIERKSAIQPSRSSPTKRMIAPVTRAVSEVRAIAFGEPETARWATAAAKSGAIVESAPTETIRLDPRRKNATVAATKAQRAVAAGIPARREVANCSGTAITRSVSPAIRSGAIHARWYPRTEVARGTRTAQP
jgi:hypothetical protein